MRIFLAAAAHPICLQALVEIGGNEWLVHAVTVKDGEAEPTRLMEHVTDAHWTSLLSHPSLLDLRTKQLWLGRKLEQAVGAAGAVSTRLLVCCADLHRMLNVLLKAVR